MIYSKEIIKHFKNPRNQGIIKNADAIGQAGNPVCGDVMKIYLKIKKKQNKKTKKNEEIIENIKFETLGCAAAIAISSILTEKIKGKSIQEALKLKKEDLVKDLHGLPSTKIHCSMLGLEALRQAINNRINK